MLVRILGGHQGGQVIPLTDGVPPHGYYNELCNKGDIQFNVYVHKNMERCRKSELIWGHPLSYFTNLTLEDACDAPE